MIKDRLLNVLGFIFVMTVFFSSIVHINATTVTFEDSISSFPNSYKPYLQKLHAKYPNWEFKPLKTKLDFNDVVREENKNNRSLVPLNSSSYIKSNIDGDYVTSLDQYVEKDSGWVKATMPIVSYFVNPANFLNEKHIFQFEDLNYDETIQTKEGVEAILKGTFMYNKKIEYINLVGDIEKTERTYSEEIMQGAITYGVSPYYLASKIRQEVGSEGSGSTSGNFLGFEGLYNFYNINAYDSSNPIANGLKWAGGGTTYKRPWITPSLSIVGGAGYIHDTFIGKGQYTSYLQRFNVNPNSGYEKYTHQYMTNIAGAASESANNYKAYANIDMLSSKKTFWIPVYENYNDTKVKFNLDNHTATLKQDVYVKSGAGMSYPEKDKILKGTKVQVLEGKLFTEEYNHTSLIYPYFYKIKYKVNDNLKEGYIYVGDVNIDDEITIKVGEKFKINYTKKGSSDVLIQSANRRSVEIEGENLVGVEKGTSELRIYSGTSMDAITVNVV